MVKTKLQMDGVVSFFVACAIVLLAFSASRAPKYNWDVIPYSALVLQTEGASVVSAHHQVFADLAASCDTNTYRDLVNGDSDYRVTVAHDPESLRQQLPFYRTRPLYILIGTVLSMITRAPLSGLQLASTVGGAFLLGMLYIWIGRIVQAKWAQVLATATICSLAALYECMRLTSPDVIASALFVFGAYCLFENGNQKTGLGVMAIAIGFRSDYVLFFLAVAIFLAISRQLSVRNAILISILSFGIAACVSAFSGHYGFQTLAYHAFIRRLPYPETSIIHLTGGQYFHMIGTGLRHTSAGLAVDILAFASLIGWTKVKRRAISPFSRFAVAILVAESIRFALFPLLDDRMVLVVIVILFLSCLRIVVETKTLVASPKASPSP